MIPSTSLAVLLLTALVPGYLYLRTTEDVRRPREYSTLDELLEVVAVGSGTTGLSTGLLILISPHWVSRTLRTASLDAPERLRASVVLVGLIAGVALGLAGVAAAVTKKLLRGTYAANVWRATLGVRRKGHIPYVVLDLKEGPRVEGLLYSYTTLDGDQPRDLALRDPKISSGEQSWSSGADFLVVSADSINRIWLSLAPDPGKSK